MELGERQVQPFAISAERERAVVFGPFRAPRIGEREATRALLLSAPREAVLLDDGWRLTLNPLRDEELWRETGEPVDIEFGIAGEKAYLRTVWPLLQRALHRAEPRLDPSDLDADLAACLLEAHFQDAFAALEESLGISCNALRLTAPEDRDALGTLEFTVSDTEGEIGYPATLFASPRLLGAAVALWRRQPLAASAPLVPCFLLAARIARCVLSRAAVSQLAVGDALLFDRIAPDSGVVLCLGEHLCACAQITDDGAFTIEEPFAANSPLSLGDFFMSDQDDESPGVAALDDAEIGSLPVNLVFELGRMEMSLDELREIGVGAPIALDRPASSAVDIIANGRRVGAGEMVLIGDQLGVRITRLNGHA